MNHAILIIRLSALGDMIISTGAFKAIKKHHPNKKLILLTTPPYQHMMQQSGFFDEVWAHPRPKYWQLSSIATLRGYLRGNHQYRIEKIYDLQRSTRTCLYYHLLAPSIPWSGIARGCDEYMPKQYQTNLMDIHAKQLRRAGIKNIPSPDISWLGKHVKMPIKAMYALIIPGCSATRPEKRWPAKYFARILEYLEEQNITPMVIGTTEDKEVIGQIAKETKATNWHNRLNKTSIEEIAALGRKATCVIGNDTGPTHIAAYAGAPTIVLLGTTSIPELCAPRTKKTTYLYKENIADITVDEVVEKIQ